LWHLNDRSHGVHRVTDVQLQSMRCCSPLPLSTICAMPAQVANVLSSCRRDTSNVPRPSRLDDIIRRWGPACLRANGFAPRVLGSKSSGCGVGRGRSGNHTRTITWHEPATNLPTSGTRRRGESAGFKSLDTGLQRRLAHAIELCWGLEAHPHPDNQLSARGLEPRECGNEGV